MNEFDPRLKDELLAQEEEKNSFDYRRNNGSKKKGIIKKLLDKIFNRYEENDEDEHTASL